MPFPFRFAALPTGDSPHAAHRRAGLAGPLLLFARRLASAALPMLCALALGSCANTLQDQPIPRTALEPLVLNSRYPVYWLGEVFHRLAIIEAVHDPGGAYTIHYGDCTEGGQYTCVSPLTIVTSPDNSFVPGGGAAHRDVSLRGVRGLLVRQGTAIELPTGPVVVSIEADSATLALAAAQTMVPIDEIAIPGAPLPASLPNTGFGEAPLAGQKPQTVRLPGVPTLRAAGEPR